MEGFIYLKENRKNGHFQPRWFEIDVQGQLRINQNQTTPENLLIFKISKCYIITSNNYQSLEIKIFDRTSKKSINFNVTAAWTTEKTGKFIKLMNTFKHYDGIFLSQKEFSNEQHYGRLVPQLSFESKSNSSKNGALESILKPKEITKGLVGLGHLALIKKIPKAGNMVVNFAVNMGVQIIQEMFFPDKLFQEMDEMIDDKLLKIQMDEVNNKIWTIRDRYIHLVNPNLTIEDRKIEIPVISTLSREIILKFSQTDHLFRKNVRILTNFLIRFTALYIWLGRITFELCPHYKREILRNFEDLMEILNIFKDLAIEERLGAIVCTNNLLDKYVIMGKSYYKVFTFDFEGHIPLRCQKIVDNGYPPGGEGTPTQYDIHGTALEIYKNDLTAKYEQFYGQYVDQVYDQIDFCQNSQNSIQGL